MILTHFVMFNFFHGAGDTVPPPVAGTDFGGYPTPVFPDNPEQERERQARWDSEKARAQAIKRLVRQALGIADDPLPQAIASEVREVAEPFVQRTKGLLRVDWKALNAARDVVAMLEQFAFAERERAMRDAADEDDEDVLMTGSYLL